MEWDKETQDKFKLMISRMPIFHRRMAEKAVLAGAEALAKARGSEQIQEGDVIGAFFKETPKPFIGLMVNLMKEVGFNYEKYQPRNV